MTKPFARMISHRAYYSWLIIAIILTIVLDQWSKEAVRAGLEYYDTIPLAGEFVTLTKVENTGAFLSLGADLNDWKHLLAMRVFPSVILAGMLVYLLIRPTFDTWLALGYGFIIGGGVANLIDRFRFGSVTDFLHMKLGPLETGIFNVADMAIMAGIGLVLWRSYHTPKAR